MKFLKKEEIDLLDKRIDNRILTFKFLSYSKNQALFHILLAFESLLDSFGVNTQDDLSKRKILYKRLYDGLNHSIQWIYENCQNEDNEFSYKNEIFFEAIELLDQAAEYGYLWAEMSLLHKNRNKIRKIKPNRFELTNDSLISEEFGVFDQCIVNAQGPRSADKAVEITPQTYDFIRTNIRIKRASGHNIEFTISPEAYISLKKSINERNILSWSMNPQWDLGGYTFQELREFWISLKTLCISYNIARSFISNFESNLALSLRIKSKKNWVDDIRKWSSLSLEVISRIIDDLTFDYSLFKSKRGRTHVMLQPFFNFNDDFLALSNGIVQISNIERNAWSLTSLLRPAISDRLKNFKEKYWISELGEKLKSLSLEIFPNIKYKEDGAEKGNIDLLIIDKQINFGLVCEMKWLTFSDDVRGKKSIDDEAEKGRGQAEKSVDWICSNLPKLAQRINYKVRDLQNIKFKPLVICKDSLPSGFLAKTNVPVMNDALINWILFDPHNRNISELWQVANSMSYLPKPGIHYENITAEILWGDLIFNIRSGAYRTKKRWSPETDIVF